MTNDERRDDTKVERDHPQTRKAEDDARGSAMWNEDVVPAGDDERGPGEDEGSDSPTVTEQSEKAESVRREAVGEDSARDAFGGDKAAPE